MAAEARRKQPVYTFSGPATTDERALTSALRDATAVRLSRGGFLIYAVDKDADVLDDETAKYVEVLRHEDFPIVADGGAVKELIQALAVTEVTDYMCMCTGELAAEFFDEAGTLLAVVRVDLPNRIEWPHWPGKALIADPARLSSWFASHAGPGA